MSLGGDIPTIVGMWIQPWQHKIEKEAKKEQSGEPRAQPREAEKNIGGWWFAPQGQWRGQCVHGAGGTESAEVWGGLSEKSSSCGSLPLRSSMARSC